MIGGLTKGDKAAEAGKTSDQLRELLVAEYVIEAINDLQKLHDKLCSPQGNDCVNGIQKFAQDGGGLCEFRLLQSYINCVEEDEPSIEKLAIMKFLRSIIEDKELHEKLCSFNDFLQCFYYIPNSTYYEKIHSQLSSIVTDCELENLEDKIRLLALLRGRMDFADIQKAYDNWRFSDLIGDNDFKRMYVDQAVKEREKPVSEYFEENIGKYIKLVEEGKEITSRYFGKWKVNFQAYCEEINNNRVLNVNLIHYDKSEPTRISDILQQEKDISGLNICCNKKHEIHAYREGKERYYEFKEGAHYEMTSTWPVKNKSGQTFMCTMVMNVSSDGITEVLKFNGEDFALSKEIMELIKQNEELYIQGLSLYDAVIQSLKKGKAADVVPTANNNFQNEYIAAVYQGNSSPPSSQTEVNLQHTGTQTEIKSQQMDKLILNNQMLFKENVELKQEMLNLKKEAVELKQEIEAGLQVINQKHHELTQENQQRQEELETTRTENVKLNQEIAELEKQNSDLQGGSEEAKQRNAELEKQNADLQNNLGRAEQKAVGLEGKLEVAKAKEEELKSELRKSKKELNHVQKGKSNLEDKFDHLEHLNKKMDGNQEQLLQEVSDLKESLSYSEGRTQELSDKLKNASEEKKEVNRELVEAKQKIEELKNQNSNSQNELKKKERGSKIEINEICKELTQLKENLKRNEEEFKSVHEEKRKLEDKLKGVNTEKKESEDKLKEFEKEIDQAAHIMKEKEQSISNLKYQMLGLENEYKAQLESYEQEIGKLENMHDEFKEYVASILESMDREHEDEIKELEENRDALGNIIAGKVLEIDGLKKRLQGEEEEKENLCNQVEELSEEIYPLNNKSREDKISNDHAKGFYILTGDISSEPDNLPPEGEKKLSRSSSVDSGLDSDEENYDDHCGSTLNDIKSVTPIREQAESRISSQLSSY